MMTRNEVQAIRERYPAGTRLELISMDDPYTRLQSGDIMVVDFVDDAGQIHGTWSNGSTLALIPDEDSFRKI